MSWARLLVILALVPACERSAPSEQPVAVACADATPPTPAIDGGLHDEGPSFEASNDGAREVGTPTRPIADTCGSLAITPSAPLTVTMGSDGYSHPHAVVLASGRVFATSGDGWNAAVFDPAHDAWEVAPPIDLDVKSSYAAADVAWLHDEVVMVVGGVGCHAAKHCPPDPKIVAAYDASARRWTALALGVTVSRLLRLADGRVLGEYLPGDWFLYDPAVDRWSEIKTIATHQSSPMAIVLKDGRVLLAGGLPSTSGSKPGATEYAEIFDPKTLVATPAAPMPTPRVEASIVRLLDGRVLVAGGRRYPAGTLGVVAVEIYDPAIDAWTSVAPLPRARYPQTATLLGCGAALVVGGWDEEGFVWPPLLTPNHPMAEAYAYSPSRDAWTILPLSIERARAAVTTLADGSALVVGGEDTDEAATTSERCR